MRTPLPITVVIPTRNEARNLAECLPRLARFAEVVVVDSGSTDGSRELAESLGARWVEFAWDGRFPKKRNWFLRQHLPKSKSPTVTYVGRRCIGGTS